MTAAAALPLLVAAPLLAAAVLAGAGAWLPRRLVDAAATAVAAGVSVLAAYETVAAGDGHVVQWLGGWQPRHGVSVGIVLEADRIGAGLATLAGVLTVAALVYSWRYLEDVSALFHALVLVFLAAISGFAVTGDLFDMFVFFELMGAVSYVLTGVRGEEPESVQGALGFGIVNSLGASCLLIGITFLYARTAALGLADIGRGLRGQPADPLVIGAFVLVVSGFLVKAAAVPFHFWTADAEAVAPTPVCLLLSGVMVVTGVYAVARVQATVFDGVVGEDAVRRALVAIGVVTALVGGVMCLLQRHLKRLLAYSTISHVGLFLIGVGLLEPEGLAGAACYALGHAGVKGALFLTTGSLLNRFETVDERALHGRGREVPLVGAVFLLGALALAGLPPSGTWLGKALVEHAATGAGLGWVWLVFLVASACTGGAVLRVGLRVFLGWGRPPAGHGDAAAGGDEHEDRETKGRIRRLPLTMLAPPAVLLAGGLLLGVVPGLVAVVGRAAATFLDGPAYAAAALGGAAPSVTYGALPGAWTLAGVGSGLLGVALAVAIAAAAVWNHRLPAWLRTLVAGPPPLVRALRVLHGGHVGDYVAWLLAGVAALGGILVL